MNIREEENKIFIDFCPQVPWPQNKTSEVGLALQRCPTLRTTPGLVIVCMLFSL